MPVPYLATLQMTFTRLPAEAASQAGDWLMVALLEHPDVIDPILTSDLDAGELVVSYEFAASGDVRTDVPKGVAMLAEAVERRSHLDGPKQTFTWEGWLASLEYPPVGTVQYTISALAV